MDMSIWFLIGAALVFFMQAGFAMLEAGLTRAKNTANILMKNFMDFGIGIIGFLLIGAGLLLGEDTLFGLLGVPNFDWITAFSSAAAGDWEAAWDVSSGFFFNLMFCATAATICSGAMAERTKFSAYLIYSFVVSAIIYPIEAHWIWGGGWLAALGFHDFAGSCAIHMAGGIIALVGAIFLGPRIGKYTKGKDGKVKVNAIPGHSLTLAALGTFILWFGWYGFNGAAAGDALSLGQILVNTTVAPAIASVATMIFVWIKNGKPDVSMTMNGALAGLVAITAPCAVVPVWAAAVIGLVAGVLVVVVVELLDKKLHIDDPVGAVGVHGANGIWGTIAVGLFADPDLISDAGYTIGEDFASGGLFLTGDFAQLGVQLLGIVAVAAWTTATIVLTFFLIKKFHGLRCSREEEIEGLDKTEHGMLPAYADFIPVSLSAEIVPEDGAEGVEVVNMASPAPLKEASKDAKMTKVVIVTRQTQLEPLKAALESIGVTGMTVTHVLGCGTQKGKPEYYRGVEMEMSLLPKVKVEVVVSKVPVEEVVDTARKALYTGHIGDGKIFVYDIEDVVKIRTGARGYDALQDEEETEPTV